MLKPALHSALLLAAAFSTTTAQLISIRTVPISQAHQFAIFPSQSVAMGGVSIALRDSILDPFSNPATGMRIGATRFFGTPSAYSVSDDAGGGRTLPVGALTRANVWYGGLWLALQQVDPSEQPEFLPPPFFGPCPACDALPVDLDRVEQSQGNSYVFALAGKEVAPGLSLGGSFLWSRLNAIDGVDMLYAGSVRVEQGGDAFDARLGLVKEWAGERTLEALVLHNRFGTAHDVYYLDTFWDPGQQQFVQQPRIEHNLDRTHTWGLHLEYEQPLSARGWHAGVIATVNQMNHPKIPNYAIMNIPRDPGHSSAFNVGIGLSRKLAGSTLGIDLIYEPIWSHTWADAASPIETRLGQTIPAGGMTIENHFRFANSIARMGLAQDVTLDGARLVGGFQLGLAVHSIHYWLDQQDHVQVSERSHEERWVEWSPTWGLTLRFPELEIRYSGSATNGTGRPGVVPPIARGVLEDLAVGGNILAAPSGPVDFAEVRVMTHQISVSLPIR